jgi:cysteine synthase A
VARYQNILQTIGNTPAVKLNKLAPADVDVYVKVESFNPMGSVKDRLALAVIEDAERSGALKPGQTVIEATSGNTGIGLAMVCAAKGYPLVVTMAESFSVERRKLLRFLGAKVVLTPAAQRGSGMLAKADFADQRLDYFVTGFGTGGTLKGVASELRRSRPGTRIVAAEPASAPLLSSKVPQARDTSGGPAGSHPSFTPHPMQGWSPDFISTLTEQAVEAELIDEIVTVAGPEAMRLTRELARQEGIFVGTSSGATLAAALQVAGRAAPGSTVLCMLPDTGERYLSTPLFEGISEAMNEEEQALSRSTPLFMGSLPIC